MKKVTTITLNGKAFTVEEDAYDKLRDYLAKAEKRLSADPDKTEILADLEQAVADKCQPYITSSKDVVSSSEVDKILADMGPVEGEEQSSNKTTDVAADDQSKPKRLYRLPEGQMLAGVCTGIAAYFNLDVTVVRLLFVLLTLMSGVGILFYIILAIVVPEAKTPEERAELRGRRFSAAEVVQSAKQRATEMEPALSRAGGMLDRLFRAISLLIAGALGALAIVLLVFASSALVSVIFGNFHLADQLASVPTYAVVLGIASLAYVVIAPLAGMAYALYAFGVRKVVSGHAAVRSIAAGVLWFVAIGILSVLGTVYSARVGEYFRTHDSLRIYGHEVRIDRPSEWDRYYDDYYRGNHADEMMPPALEYNNL